jgi:hypothetical protein
VASRTKKTARKNPKSAEGAGTPKSLKVAERGLKNTKDFVRLMDALIADTIAGRVTHSITNASCNAGGKMLRATELTFRYGEPVVKEKPRRRNKVLDLAT